MTPSGRGRFEHYCCYYCCCYCCCCYCYAQHDGIDDYDRGNAGDDEY